MKNSLVFVILAITLLLGACAKGPSGKAKLKFSLGYQVAIATNTVKIFGMKSGYPLQEFKPDLGASYVDVTIPTGDWTFYSIEWNGSAPYTGSIRCGVASATIDLAKTNDVSLNPSEANCGNAFFNTQFDNYCYEAAASDNGLFRAGDGTTGSPYVVCSIAQLNAIGENFASLRTSHFKLGRDLNYYGGWDRIDLARKFVMIGPSPLASSTGTGTNESFIGSFDGGYIDAQGVPRNHVIKGMVINSGSATLTAATEYTGFGFIRNLGDGASVSNLTFIMPEIELGKSYNGGSSYNVSKIGIVAGIVTSSIATHTISNVHVKYAHVSGKDAIGGLVGYVASPGFIQISNSSFSEDSSVEALGNAGGLIGSALSGFCGPSTEFGIYRSFVDAEVRSQGYCSNSNYYNQSTCTSASGTWYAGQAGGMIGEATAVSPCYSKIKESFTKGDVQSSSSSGGFIGNLKAGSPTLVIEDSYSTSNISAYESSGKAGGFIGSALTGASATISRAFHTEGGIKATNVGGIISGPLSVLTCNDVFFTSVANDYCTNTTSSTWKSTNDIRNRSITYSNWNWSGNISTVQTDGIPWVMDDDISDYPRLAWEGERACHDKFDTIVGDGQTADTAIEICSKAQFDLIDDAGYNGKYFILKNNIDLMSNSGISTPYFPTALQVNLEGNDYKILNLKLNPSTGSGFGLFKELSAGSMVRNLELNNISILGATANYVGALAGTNYGTIYNVKAKGSLSGTSHIGGIVGSNNGKITYGQSEVEVKGNNHLGGIAGSNASTGTITYSQAYKMVQYEYSSPHNIGGLVGLNEGIIYESSSRASLENSAASGIVTAIGGLVGLNNGSITNTFTYGNFSGTGGINYDGIGGLAGQSSVGSSLTNSYTAMSWTGLISIDASSYWGTFVGKGTPYAYNGLFFKGGTAPTSYTGTHHILGSEIAFPSPATTSGWQISPYRDSHEGGANWNPAYEIYPWYMSGTMTIPELRRQELDKPDSFYYGILGF